MSKDGNVVWKRNQADQNPAEYCRLESWFRITVGQRLKWGGTSSFLSTRMAVIEPE